MTYPAWDEAQREVRRLRTWTPIAFQGGDRPVVEWADLRAHRFERPFFFQTLEAWRAGGAGSIAESGLSTLAELDSEPSLDPDVIIVHPSRCGSTLLARLLAAMHEQSVLVGEPELLFQLLQANLERPFEAPAHIWRQAVRALGRIRFGAEQRYILKLSSRTSRFLPLIRRAFPKTPIIWVQRTPKEIVESNLKAPSIRLTGLGAEEVGSSTLRDISLAFLAAHAFKDSNFHIVDYRDLPEAAWVRIAPLMQWELGNRDLDRMREIGQSHAHTGKPFSPRTASPLPEDIQAIVRSTLNPLYEALAGRAGP